MNSGKLFPTNRSDKKEWEDAMPDATIILKITPIPWLSLLLWVLIGLTVLYLARRPFQQVIDTLSRLIYNSMRLAATALKIAADHLQTLNREVLFAHGIDQAQRQSERELDRISDAVQRKLATYPQLERQIKERLLTMEADHRNSAEVPQDLPNWVNILNAIAAIPSAGDPMVERALQDIHKTLKTQYKTALENHRKAMSTRHRILSRMLPRWNSTEKRLNQLQNAIAQLSDDCVSVDRSVATLESVRLRADVTKRRLLFSSTSQFVTSSLLLGVFTIGAIINFNLIALPMSEMLGGHSYMAGFHTSDVAGVLMVCLQVVLGIFLMDAAQVTRLLSSIGGMNDKKRAWFFWSVLAMLTILAGVESSMAFIRDRIASDMQALEQSLAGMNPPSAAASHITVISQMILGFLLPCILATAAIPIESVIRSSRILLGMVSVWALRLVIFLLRLSGSLVCRTGRGIIRIYDLIIFPAIWLEDLIGRRLKSAKPRSNTATNRLVDHESTASMVKETVGCKKNSD